VRVEGILGFSKKDTGCIKTERKSMADELDNNDWHAKDKEGT